MNQDRIRFEIQPAMQIDALGLLWCDLQTRAEASFFLDWQWIGTWLLALDRRPEVLIGWQDGRIVLLGALMPEMRTMLSLPVHGLRLHAVGDDDIDVITMEYNGFLVDRAVAGQAEMEAVGFLLRGPRVAGHRRDELHMKGVGGAFSGPDWFQPGRLPVGAYCVAVSRKPAWHVDLDAVRAAGGSYLDSLSANTRQQIRRSMRLYAARGALRAERAGTVGQAHGFLAVLKARHQEYWTGRGEPGAFSYPFFEAFQKRLIDSCLESGAIELFQVWCGDLVIGTLYNFVHRGRVMSYQTGFHYEEDKRLKPGLVSHALCIQRHLDEGAAMYDFMAGEARYKANLGQPGPDMTYWMVGRPTVTLWAERGLKGLKQGVLRRLGK